MRRLHASSPARHVDGQRIRKNTSDGRNRNSPAVRPQRSRGARGSSSFQLEYADAGSSAKGPSSDAAACGGEASRKILKI